MRTYADTQALDAVNVAAFFLTNACTLSGPLARWREYVVQHPVGASEAAPKPPRHTSTRQKVEASTHMDDCPVHSEFEEQVSEDLGSQQD